MSPESPVSRAQAAGARKLLTRTAGIFAVLAGAALLSVAGLYTYWKLRSGSDADHFNFQTPDIEVITGHSGTPEDLAPLVSLYPGNRINPRYWSDPEWAGAEPFGAPGIPDGFTPVSSRDPVAAQAALALPTRIRIPAINLDSIVSELQLLDLGDQSAYATPNNVVGHIPATSSPGQLGSGWYFGHLESFVAGEGNVFNRLPEITDLIRSDPVDIFIQTDDSEYMYRVTSTSQVREQDLEVTQSDNSQVTLVTCWPPHVYDRRVLVHAELIAVKR